MALGLQKYEMTVEQDVINGGIVINSFKKEKGMERSVIILANSVTTMQFRRIAQETGIYQWERYIDASKVTNWEEIGKKWLVKAEDPDKK